MGYKNEILWELLKSKAEESNHSKPVDRENAHHFISGVEKICDLAINRAKAIRDTFPTYTLHDEDHICNVLRLMVNLSGPRISGLTRDETAMLILSACCHDIGMSYNDDDKQDALSNRERLDKYLEKHPSEYVKAYENNPDEPVLTDAMLQDYFRSIHHERIQNLLYAVEWPSILNGSVNREDLIAVCKSHGKDVSFLEKMNATPTIDLRMCAVLLRLASVFADAQYRHLSLSQWFDTLRDIEDISKSLTFSTEKDEFLTFSELSSSPCFTMGNIIFQIRHQIPCSMNMQKLIHIHDVVN